MGNCRNDDAFDVCNQVKILMKEGETLDVPEFDDIYADSEVI